MKDSNSLQLALLSGNVASIKILVADGAILSKEFATELLITNDIDKINHLSGAGGIEQGLFDVIDITDPQVIKAVIELNNIALIKKCLIRSDAHRFKMSLLQSRNTEIEIIDFIFTSDFVLSYDEEKAILREAIQTKLQNKVDYLKTKGITITNHTDLIDLTISLLMPTPEQTEELLKLNLSVEQISHLLAQAIKYGSVTVYNMLISREFLLSPEFLQNPLLAAIDKGDSDIVMQLIQMGANPSADDTIMRKAVTAAVPNPKVINILLDCGANPRALGCYLPVIAVDRYFALNNIQYLYIINILLKRIVQTPDKIDDLFKKYNNSSISPSMFKTAIKHMIKQSLTKPHQVAFDLLILQNDYLKRLAEYASDESLSRRANTHFNNYVEPFLLDKFNSYPGDSQVEKIEAIEKELKTFLLSQITKTCLMDPSANNKAIVDYIHQNSDKLIQGNDELIMSQFRKLVTSNELSAQVAWRAYDANAPYKHDFENLLTQQVSKNKIYTTSASADTLLRADEASLLVRYRLAIYFLEIQNLNQFNFIQQLADIRRANAIGQIDCPSCFPGTIGRIAKLGEGHPVLQLPPTRREIIVNQINAMVIKSFSEYLEEFGYKKGSDLYLSLVTIRPENAADVISRKIDFNEKMLTMRQSFIKKTFTNNKHITTINSALESANEPTLGDSDSMDITRELMDIAASGRSMQLHQRLNAYKPKEAELQRTPFKPTPNVIINNNPFLVAKTSLPAMFPADRIKLIMNDRIMRFIEYELVFDIFAKHFTHNQSELAKNWVNELFATAKNPSLEHRIQTFEKIISDDSIIQNQPQEVIFKLKMELLNVYNFGENSKRKIDKLISRVIKAHSSNEPIFNEILRSSLNTVINQLQERNKLTSHPPRP